MYELAVEQIISAGHQLREYSGKCERCHGHNWKIRLEVSAAVLDSVGLAVDFGVLKTVLNEIVGPYDHVMLNELAEFQEQNPTSENLARLIYQKCSARLAAINPGLTVKSVTVWESETSSARYYEP